MAEAHADQMHRQAIFVPDADVRDGRADCNKKDSKAIKNPNGLIRSVVALTVAVAIIRRLFCSHVARQDHKQREGREVEETPKAKAQALTQSIRQVIVRWSTKEFLSSNIARALPSET